MTARAPQGQPGADGPAATFWGTVRRGARAGLLGYGVPHLLIALIVLCFAPFLVYAGLWAAPVCLLVGPLIGAVVGGIAVALSLALPPAPTPGGRFLFQCLLAILGALTYLHGEMLEGALLGYHADAFHTSLLEYYTTVIGDIQELGFLYLVFAPLVAVGAFTSFRLGGWVTRPTLLPAPRALRAPAAILLGAYVLSSGALLVTATTQATHRSRGART